MTTSIIERPAAPAAPAPPSRSGSRFQRWLASWRVSLKMARRDALRYKGRSVLVLIMVALPVGLIVAGLTFASTSTRSTAEKLPWLLGNGQAMIHSISTDVVEQGVEGQQSWSISNGDNQPPAAKRIPGLTDDGTLAQRTKALGAIVPGTLVPVQTGEFRWTDLTRRPYGTVMFIDPSVDLGPKLHLVSGRWPASNDEIVVTPAGLHNGLPGDGTLELNAGETRRQITIVGIADVFDTDMGMPYAMTTAAWDERNVYSTSWIVKRSTPMSWAEVRKLNGYGLAITSADVVAHPPPASEMPGQGYDAQRQMDTETKVMAAIFGAVLFLVTALLVGPAFAVSAGRQRRSLALAASNGAEVRQLRRSVLAGALILGVLAAVAGAALGAASVAAGAAVWRGIRPWSTLVGPFDIPMIAVIIVLICAVLAALTAAMIPALRLGRLDIVGVMKGQNVSPPHNRILPFVGLALFALGAAGLFLAVTANATAPGVAGVFGLVGGAICVIPLGLVWAGRLAGRFPVAVRMATRDAARQRHRSAPTVAALMAGAALLATFAIALESNSRFEAKHYQPQTVAGEGTLWSAESEYPTLIKQITTLAPTWRVVEERAVQGDYTGNTAPTSEPFVVVVPPGCSTAQALPQLDDGSAPPPEQPAADPCRTVTSIGYLPGATRYGVTVVPAAEIARRLQLPKADAAAVAGGAVLVGDEALIKGGTVTLAMGSATNDPKSGTQSDPKVTTTKQVPAIAISESAYQRAAVESRTGLVIPTEVAGDINLQTAPSSLHVYDTRGAITKADQKKVAEQLANSGVNVERGYERPDKWLMLGVLGITGFLLVTVTLISTALALAEQQADMGTLAAVGATKGTRRRFAAAQAATVALLGGLLGIAIGLVAGVAIAWPTTTTWWDDLGPHKVAPTIGIPVLPILIIVLGVPLIAATIAAASIRRAPHVTRRGN